MYICIYVYMCGYRYDTMYVCYYAIYIIAMHLCIMHGASSSYLAQLVIVHLLGAFVALKERLQFGDSGDRGVQAQ